MELIFFGIGLPEGFRSQLLLAEAQAHGMYGLTRDIGSSSFLSHISSLKLRPRPRLVVRRLKAVTHASNSPETRMHSLPLRTAILKSKSLKMAAREILSTVPSHRQQKRSSNIGQEVWCGKQSCSSRHSNRHPGLSSAVWNLAAVHRPSHAMRKAPTIRLCLHELAVRHNPCMSKCTR